MSFIHKLCVLAAIVGLSQFGLAQAAVVQVTDNISQSTVWTADNVYRLQNQIYVLPGATLTIQQGTVIASTAGVGGSLAVSRGARIFVNGTAQNPVIMTSTSDVDTWAVQAGHPSGRDPKSGTWREGVNEWGNLTIMGNALISASHTGGAPVAGNTKTPTGANVRQMEGLTADFPGDTKVIYGGNDDNDDSGSISYLSLRYGGRVIGLNNELNGLSLGGIGRETDISYVEIMNNVDDGIEIWGGTVNLDHVSIWNIGDDSFDIDQGWRGKAQFGLIVQGFSADADQGSGVGDNMFETDGAEDSDAQPVTTGVIYNFTAIGQPAGGDHATAWRDNARMQYRNCIFMETGGRLVSFDNDDGDGAQGYGFNGTLSWENTWQTPAGTHSTVNAITPVPAPGAFNHPDTMYTTQADGMLAQITDSVFYSNQNASAYTEADARGVRDFDNNNVTASQMPIQGLARAAAETKGGETMVRVTSLNPSAAADARTSVDVAPNDGFFTPAPYRGGFSADTSENWLLGWTAADAFGMVSTASPATQLIVITENIAESQTWTANNVYSLAQQIYVLPGASLSIEPGTTIINQAGVGGSLAVSRGARIFVNGTQDEPVIFTSSSDYLTWTPDATHPSGRNPKTGTWREGVNEWGNLTIMGNALISASHTGGAPVAGNTKLPDGNNVRQMEGLTADFPGDTKVIYGGNDDNDDSGSISYLSLRYGGRVIGLNNELNGLSLGGIGRETDISYVEIMNNVDDGIEIWGGTVNLDHVSIWNIGDDSFDIDQGWRGKAQFGLIVQGFSADADQGSGVGDNMFETDGAEDSDAQPVTTGVIYNFTAIGQPAGGDHATAWRDNARMQYRNCIFMETGGRLVSFDNDDGDGAQGYGFNGTLSWENTWQTPAGTHSTVNAITPVPAPGAFNHPDTMYTTQADGMLAQITDSVFYSNQNASAYTEADARGVRNPANNNVTATQMPIQGLTRAGVEVKGGETMVRVTSLNPLPANDATSSVGSAPSDGFLTPANYRGGFGPNTNWLVGWTAADAFGMVVRPTESSVSSNQWLMMQ